MNFDRLKESAEKALDKRQPAPRTVTLEEAKHELEVQEIELHLQNEELQSTEAALRHTLERYRLLYELSPVGLFTLDAEGVILDSNVHATHVFNLREGQPAKLADYVSKDSAHLLSEHLLQAREGSGIVTGYCSFVRPTGERFRGRLTSSQGAANTLIVALLDREPEIRPFETLARERVVRREIESELVGTRSRLAAIIETAADAIIVFGEDGMVELANAATETMFGRSRDAVLHSHIQELIDIDDDWEQFLRMRDSAHEREGIRDDGTRFPIEIRLSEMDDDGRRTFTAIARDQTHMKALERKFVEAQRLEAAGVLAAGIAHDFNNILMGINGCASQAERQLSAGHPARQPIVEIRTAVQSAASIARQLLAFARRPGGATDQLADLDKAIIKARKLTESLIPENIRTRWDIGSEGLVVVGESGHIEQTMVNLVINACDAMPHGGVLEIQTRSVELTEQLERHNRVLEPGRYASISVSDTGEGIAAEHIDLVFEPFFSTKTLGRGSGLGLSMVYGTTRAMGGMIDVKSRVGEGTTFEILLPAKSGPTKGLSREMSTSEFARIPAQPRRVLVVEDDALVARAVSHFLEADGHTVYEARSRAEAESMARRHRNEIDMLLTDAVLPDAFGADVASAVARIVPDVHVIFMSAHPRSNLLESDSIWADHPCLHKPFEAVALKRAMVESYVSSPPKKEPSAGAVLLVDDHLPSLSALEAILGDMGIRVVTASSSADALKIIESQPIRALVTDLRLHDGSGADLVRDYRKINPSGDVVYMSGADRDSMLKEFDLDENAYYLVKPFDVAVLHAYLDPSSSS